MCSYKYVQSHIIILHQQVTVTHVIIIGAPYNKKTSEIPHTTNTLQKCMI